MGNSAIGRGTAVEDFKVKASSTDATPGFLDGKVGSGMGVVSDLLESNAVTFIGTFTRDNTVADGTQAITGVGFQPTYIIFLANVASAAPASWGFGDSAASVGLSNRHAESPNEYETRTLDVIHSRTATSVANAGRLQSLDSDGFTINWVKQNSPTGTTTARFIAIK